MHENDAYGISHWKKLYLDSHPDISAYQIELDEDMKKFDEENQRKYDEMKSKTNVVDEDGWTLVTSAGKRNKNTDGKINVVASRAQDLQSLKRKESTLSDFYRFQKKESKKEKLEVLQKKFDEDKKKIAALKATRAFKPYF